MLTVWFYLLERLFDLTKFQIFLVISLGAIGFLPNTCSTVSVRPVKSIAYPPKAGFFVLVVDFVFLLELRVAFFFVVVFFVVVVFFFAANFSYFCFELSIITYRFIDTKVLILEFCIIQNKGIFKPFDSI